MICFPNAKLNLGLFVTARRSDGYHCLETVFAPLPLCDVLEVEPSLTGRDSLYIVGQGEVVSNHDNLVVRALEALRLIRDIPPTSIALEKHIPSMAGLGGGSADAAFMLHLLNDRFSLDLSSQEMEQTALSLGADCPFFLYNRPAIARGIGEELEPLPISLLRGVAVVVVRPPVDISTPEAYASLGFSIGETRSGMTPELLSALRGGNLQKAVSQLSNAFEEQAIAQYPQISLIKEELYQSGAFFALMSGSGSAVYGLYSDAQLARLAAVNPLFSDFFCWQGCY
ncbi:4-diphosphocytidyl-2-C-methyl-D-erythritol kinase [Porphyromonas crevioricanis]|uniref:4-diphosphocytidyl-2-C-methyl-D-erythritol kinase n=1 Tax=Porphyromonas crevioricanis TaxID=393921 RepID=A0A2X4PPH6_9PORP|nr:4-(cytidine 5'-diphospho)-2-C-methyl-D-erythritol kinase [Porphyromonas crevioricanis]GAD08332.1 4-diphosphocytidyl-2-C-methyl-D-erythritol kinase [Porphyromonas crevioricanis JCM 13913]SQH73783.1 4-diphosphocytidyl-2-C-methyl-D-erythritol kinase [Porphyromonas crevioricanis]